jgi:hypothetical protein
MNELESNSREMETLDFTTVRNFKSSEFFDYMIKHKVWITKNNFKLASERLGWFNRYMDKARRMRKKSGIIFYLPEDEEIRTEKNITKSIDIVKINKISPMELKRK